MGNTKNRYIAYQNEYIREKYDRINFVMPKGFKAEIQERSQSLGCSVNEYLLSLVRNDISGKSNQEIALQKSGLTDEQIEILKKGQVARAYYDMIESVELGRGHYVVRLKPGYTNDVFGGRVLDCQNMKELRTTINKSHKVGAKPPTKANNPQSEFVIPERFSDEEREYLQKWQIPQKRYEQIKGIEFLPDGVRIIYLMPGYECEGASEIRFDKLKMLRRLYPKIKKTSVE